MANLDTRDKRGSAVGIDLNWVHIYPDPDGIVAGILDEERQQVAYKYMGISATTGTVSAVLLPYRMMMGWGV